MHAGSIFGLLFAPLVIFSGALLVLRHPSDSNRVLSSTATTITGVEKTLTGQ